MTETPETISLTQTVDVSDTISSTFMQTLDATPLSTFLFVTSTIEGAFTSSVSELLPAETMSTNFVDAFSSATILSPASVMSSELFTSTFITFTDLVSTRIDSSTLPASTSITSPLSETNTDTFTIEAVSSTLELASVTPTVSALEEVSPSLAISPIPETSSDTPSTIVSFPTDPATTSFSSIAVTTPMETTTATKSTSATTNITTNTPSAAVVTASPTTQAPNISTTEYMSTTVTAEVTFETVFSTEEVVTEIASITTTQLNATASTLTATSTMNATAEANTTASALTTPTALFATPEDLTTSVAPTTASSTSKTSTTFNTTAAVTTTIVVNITENVTTQAATNGTTPAPTTATTVVPTALPTTPARPEGPRKVVPAGLTMQLDFNSNYDDRNSVEFTTLATQVVESKSYLPSKIVIIMSTEPQIPGSVVARYAAVFASDQAESDSAIQQQVQTNLQVAINNGTFNGTLNVTDSQAVQPIALTTDELELVSTDPSFCTLTCGEGGVCQLGEKFPGVVIAECVCVENYCFAGTCTVIVDQGPKCSCPADTLSWYRGDRCEVTFTQAQIIGFAVGCTAAVLVLIILLVVCMAKRARNMLRAQKARRYRYDMGGFVMGNRYSAHPLADTGFFHRTGRYSIPHTDSTASSRLYTWNPTVKNVPGGEIKIPRVHAPGKVFPKQERIYAQTIEMRF
ncbi:cell wall protein DAN4-like [Branchiostoma floridae]|uniref:Cell wall protein DAN4-like n=1 Tax=Branchiostoma floridae TaxID=7739 RepID=A0A9J7HJG7_BRAFL|nr:cell wall protein DAN4-like [Branchiostoma floridae]